MCSYGSGPDYWLFQSFTFSLAGKTANKKIFENLYHQNWHYFWCLQGCHGDLTSEENQILLAEFSLRHSKNSISIAHEYAKRKAALLTPRLWKNNHPTSDSYWGTITNMYLKIYGMKATINEQNMSGILFNLANCSFENYARWKAKLCRTLFWKKRYDGSLVTGSGGSCLFGLMYAIWLCNCSMISWCLSFICRTEYLHLRNIFWC